MRQIRYNITSATQKEVEFIDDRLGEFNLSQVPATHEPTLILKNYVIKDKEKIIAGIKACVYHWGILYVELLFVSETHRFEGLGSTLLQKVEQEAQEMGASLAHLDTFDFQALDFYLNHGYEVFGVLEDCPKSHKRYYLKKSL